MSMLVLPAGLSLREIAGRLGVPVEELQRHAHVDDVERPLAAERRVEVPDGFLRSRKRDEELRDAVTSPSGKRAGMNSWLALDIERKRTLVAGELGNKRARDVDLEALDEARRAYLRFEAASNRLALELYAALTQSVSSDVRARAFAGQSIAQAQAHLLYAEPARLARTQALSLAKAAILADPKLAEAHLGMALALTIEPSGPDVGEARAELERAVSLDPGSAWCWASLGQLELDAGRVDEATTATHTALEHAPDYPLALATAAQLAVAAEEPELAVALLSQAVGGTPTFANGHLALAVVLHAMDRTGEAGVAAASAKENATTDLHAAWILAKLREGCTDHST